MREFAWALERLGDFMQLVGIGLWIGVAVMGLIVAYEVFWKYDE